MALPMARMVNMDLQMVIHHSSLRAILCAKTAAHTVHQFHSHHSTTNTLQLQTEMLAMVTLHALSLLQMAACMDDIMPHLSIFHPCKHKTQCLIILCNQ
jgi:hypothetical protein